MALEIDGQIVLGVITRPLREQRWWAARGHGAFADTDQDPVGRSRQLVTSEVSSLQRARVGLYRREVSQLPGLLADLGAQVAPHGASHILDLVEGRIDGIVSERCGFLWDHAPSVVLTSEAGGRFSDPAGGVRADLQGGIYSNGALHGHLGELIHNGVIELAGAAS